MGSSLSRSVKAVRSDGNGNVEAVVVQAPGDPPAPRMPVSVELLCDRPSDPRYLFLSSHSFHIYLSLT
jgi:hypothetical protein